MRSTEAQLRLRRMSKLSLVRMVQSAKLVIVSTRKPSLTMADFTRNSAILTAVRPNAVLTAAYSSSPRHAKWQTSLASLPLLDLVNRVRMSSVERRTRERWQIVNDLWETDQPDVNQLNTTAC